MKIRIEYVVIGIEVVAAVVVYSVSLFLGVGLAIFGLVLILLHMVLGFLRGRTPLPDSPESRAEGDAGQH